MLFRATFGRVTVGVELAADRRLAGGAQVHVARRELAACLSGALDGLARGGVTTPTPLGWELCAARERH